MKLTILSAPRTKKNHGRIVKAGARRIMLPSVQFEGYQAQALRQLRRVGIDYPVNCRALFYRDRLSGDAVGYYQALADILEKAGVVTNDRLIVSWDGSRLLKDAKHPRVELELTPVGE